MARPAATRRKNAFRLATLKVGLSFAGAPRHVRYSGKEVLHRGLRPRRGGDARPEFLFEPLFPLETL